jgi:hypothetical protein
VEDFFFTKKREQKPPFEGKKGFPPKLLGGKKGSRKFAVPKGTKRYRPSFPPVSVW